MLIRKLGPRHKRYEGRPVRRTVLVLRLAVFEAKRRRQRLTPSPLPCAAIEGAREVGVGEEGMADEHVLDTSSPLPPALS
jgi:hypothetical protein